MHQEIIFVTIKKDQDPLMYKESVKIDQINTMQKMHSELYATLIEMVKTIPGATIINENNRLGYKTEDVEKYAEFI